VIKIFLWSANGALEIVNKGGVRLGPKSKDKIYFYVRGQTEEHSVIWARGKEPSCTCIGSSAYKQTCQHIVATYMFWMVRKTVEKVGFQKYKAEVKQIYERS